MVMYDGNSAYPVDAVPSTLRFAPEGFHSPLKESVVFDFKLALEIQERTAKAGRVYDELAQCALGCARSPDQVESIMQILDQESSTNALSGFGVFGFIFVFFLGKHWLWLWSRMRRLVIGMKNCLSPRLEGEDGSGNIAAARERDGASRAAASPTKNATTRSPTKNPASTSSPTKTPSKQPMTNALVFSSPTKEPTDAPPSTANPIENPFSSELMQINTVLEANNNSIISRLANDQATEQFTQRWESKGLDRQKSLEVAAHFEVKMIFLWGLQHIALDIVNRFVWMHFNNLEHIKQQHSDQMNAPYLEEMKKHRQDMTYRLLNFRFLTRCIILALASRFYFMNGNALLWNWVHIPSFNNMLNHVFSFICPECSTELILSSSSYGLLSFRSYMYSSVESISCTVICSMKIVWYAALLLFCHQYISKSLSCGVVALLIVDWKSICQLGVVVTVMNLMLTMMICKHMDAKGETMGTREASKYYERCTLSSEVLAHLISILVGFFFSHDNSSWQV
jgi:hypothetical protein